MLMQSKGGVVNQSNIAISPIKMEPLCIVFQWPSLRRHREYIANQSEQSLFRSVLLFDV